MLLVGNKSDLNSKRIISEGSAKEVADKLGILFCETSAKTLELTKMVFDELIEKILKRKKGSVGKKGEKPNFVISYKNIKKSNSDNSCC